MDIIEQVKEVAVGYLKGVMTIGPDDDATFRMLITTSVDGEAKPLLLLGNAHRKFDDGHCIAILNPDAELVDKLGAGCGCSGFNLKELVTKRCDVMLDVWIQGDIRATIGSRYRAHSFKPAKFVVR
jgi:hypothetical protein